MAAQSKRRPRSNARRRANFTLKSSRRTNRTRRTIPRNVSNPVHANSPNPVINVNPIFNVSLSNGTSSLRTSGPIFRNPDTDLIIVSLFNQDPAHSHTVTISILDWQNAVNPFEFAKFAFLGGELINPPEENNQGEVIVEENVSEDASRAAHSGEALIEEAVSEEASFEEGFSEDHPSEEHYSGEHIQDEEEAVVEEVAGEAAVEKYAVEEVAVENPGEDNQEADIPVTETSEEGTESNENEAGNERIIPITTPFTFTIPPRQLLLIHAYPPDSDAQSVPMYEILAALPVDSVIPPILVNAWGINHSGRIQEGNTVLHHQFAVAFPAPY